MKATVDDTGHRVTLHRDDEYTMAGPKPASAERAVIPQSGVRMPRGSKPSVDERERRPARNSGWREQKRRARGIAPVINAISYSVWRRGEVMAVSALEDAEAPDGRGDIIPQWHISFAGYRRRSTDEECRQALACFGLAGAEEDNHHPGGGARHFWMPLDAARRVDCECRTTETVIVEPDGYRSTTPADGPCSGCELAAVKAALGEPAPCPIHGTEAEG